MMVNAEPRITNLMVELVSCNGCRIQACAAILALELFWPCIIPFFHIIFFKNKPPDIPMDMGTLLLRSPCLQVPSSSLLAFFGIVNAYISIAVAYTPASIVVVGHHPLLVGAVNFLLDIPYKFLENRRLDWKFRKNHGYVIVWSFW